MDLPDRRRELVTVEEAAARLGISPTEVRRRIKAGTLPAEKFQRPQGEYSRVIFYLPDDPPTTSQDLPSTSPDLPAAISAATEPLERRLVVQDATIAEQSRRIDQQAREIAALSGKLGHAESDAKHLSDALDSAEAERKRLADELERQRARPWWERLWG